MYARSLAAVCLVICSMSSAYATDSVPLCNAPLDPDCVDPKWGMIDPVDSDLSLAAPSSLARTPGGTDSHIAIRAMPTAMEARSSRSSSATLKAVIDGTKRFTRETARLADAVKKARFDRDGKVVQGAAEIVAAAEAARKVATNFALTLYIRVPAHLKGDQSAVLFKKIAAINELLASSGKGGGAAEAGKPVS